MSPPIFVTIATFCDLKILLTTIFNVANLVSIKMIYKYMFPRVAVCWCDSDACGPLLILQFRLEMTRHTPDKLRRGVWGGVEGWPR